MAGTVSDVLDRRTQSSYRDARAAADAAAGVAALIGPELGWDEDRMRGEADAYAARIRADLTRAGLDPGDLDPGGPDPASVAGRGGTGTPAVAVVGGSDGGPADGPGGS